MQKMHGPDNCYCPLWRKKMSAVCHTCPWWVQLRGTNPNTGAEVDGWECSITAMPLLQIETAKQTRQAGAATESFRNEMVRISTANQITARLRPAQLEDQS